MVAKLNTRLPDSLVNVGHELAQKFARRFNVAWKNGWIPQLVDQNEQDIRRGSRDRARTLGGRFVKSAEHAASNGGRGFKKVSAVHIGF